MSRVAKNPIELPAGVEVKIDGQSVSVKGAKGTMTHAVHPLVGVNVEGGALLISVNDASQAANALSGTTRALLANMVNGVVNGFQRKLEIVGVGYRAQVQGAKLNLSLGYSHPIEFEIPEGITIETPSQTEILIKGIDKQRVGQIAANIRAYRPPEPYKGKGVRYGGEKIVKKEAKKS